MKKSDYIRISFLCAIFALAALLLGCNTQSTEITSGSKIDRTILPIQPPKGKAITELDARNVKAPPRFQVKAPEGAPNVVIVRSEVFWCLVTSTFG